jgi:hypothetical protein
MIMMTLLDMAGLQSKREISRECNDIVGSAKGSQISEKHWGVVGKGNRADIYLEVRKRRGHIFLEWNECLCMSFCFINPSWQHLNGGIMSNATFNNISAISWWSVLLVEETRVPGENHRPAASHWQTLSHTVVSDTPRHAQALVSD